MMMASGFSPIDIGGFAPITGTGTWSQLQWPGAALPLLPVAIPDGATLAIVFASTDLRYCLSPSDATGTGMLLTAGDSMVLSTRDAIYQFCLNTGAGCIQFWAGAGAIHPISMQ